MGARNQDLSTVMRGLNGTPVYMGTIVVAAAGTQKDNLSTATPFTLKGGEQLLLQGDNDFYLHVGTSASYTASGAKSVKVLADSTWSLGLLGSDAGVANITIDGVSTAVNVKVFRLS